jgi:hypothetical protein
VTELLRRLHELLRARLSTRAARIAATVLAVAGTAAVGVPLVRTSSSLAAQRVAILDALRECSAARRDPAAVQLIERGMVRVGDRDYGGPLVVGRPLDLFDGRGEMPAETKEDLSWRMLADQVPAWMPYALVKSPPAVAVLLAGALAAALGAVWAGFLLPALEGGLLVAAVTAFCWRMGWTAAAQWTVSAALCFLLFGFLWQSVRLLLSARGGPVAVAGNTALEGIRTLALPGFALPVALLLPFLALSRERGEALLQAIPAFLDWGHTVAYAFAAIFVILFGCATSAFEVRDRQVWSVVTKPVSGGGWLLGKWLGTLALGMTVVVGGTLLLGLGARYLAAQRPLDERDARDVRETVLIGRVGTLPEYQEMDAAALREAIDAEIESDGVMRADIANGLRDEAEIRRTIAARRKREFLDQQRRIGPGDSREFTFRGLRGAVDSGRRVSLRYRFHGGGEDEHMRFPAMIQYASGKDAGSWELREWVPGEPYTVALDPKFVDPDGTLRIRIFSAGWDEASNQPVPGTITMFMTDDSLEVMAEDSTFAGNLASAAAVDLCKIAFLAALAVCAGALLSFPIAVLLAFGVFALATLAPFLSTALSNWNPDERSGVVIWAFQQAVLGVATAVEFLLRGFSARSPSDSLAQGRSITWASLSQAALGIGFLWTFGTLAVGWLGVRRKEMAVYGGNA